MKNNNKSSSPCAQAGLTIIELLVATAVVGVLSMLTVAVSGQVRKSAERVEETTSARQLSQAYLLYSQDHDGAVIPGVLGTQESAMLGLELVNHHGQPLSNGPAKQRITFRLLPYVGDIRAFYPGAARQFIDDAAGRGNEDYMISLCPFLGLNQTYLGGNQQNPRWDHSRDTLTYSSQAVNPSSLIVFASSLLGPASDVGIEGGDYAIGLFRVDAPNGETKAWSGSYNKDIPANLGHIRLDDSGRALVTHLDGSVTFLDEEELGDMRRWSNRAALLNNPNYAPSGVRY